MILSAGNGECKGVLTREKCFRVVAVFHVINEGNARHMIATYYSRISNIFTIAVNIVEHQQGRGCTPEILNDREQKFAKIANGMMTTAIPRHGNAMRFYCIYVPLPRSIEAYGVDGQWIHEAAETGPGLKIFPGHCCLIRCRSYGTRSYGTGSYSFPCTLESPVQGTFDCIISRIGDLGADTDAVHFFNNTLGV